MSIALTINTLNNESSVSSGLDGVIKRLSKRKTPYYLVTKRQILYQNKGLGERKRKPWGIGFVSNSELIQYILIRQMLKFILSEQCNISFP